MEVQFQAPEPGPNAPAPEQSQQNEEIVIRSPEDAQKVAKSLKDTKAELTRVQQELARLKGQQQPDPQSPQDDQQNSDPSNQQQQQPDPSKVDPNDPKSVDEAAEKLAKDAGLDLAPYQEEFFSTGDVTPENRDKIAKALEKQLGPSARQIVDDFVESRKVTMANDQNLYMQAAGGQEQFQKMIQWASQTLPKEQVEAYNKQVNSGDRHATLFAIEGLRAKYEAQVGREPNLLQGRVNTNSSQGFKSAAEMRRAMADPRYKEDEAYRNEVKARLAVSNF